MKLTRREFLHASAFSALGAVTAGLIPGATAYAEGGIKSSAKPMMAVQQIMLGTLTGTEEKAVQTLNAVRVALQNFQKTIVVQFVFKVIG